MPRLQLITFTGNLIRMPELPDIEAYLGALRTRVVGERLAKIRVASPFLLRTAEPPLSSAEGHVCRESCDGWANASPSDSTTTSGWCCT